MIVIDAAALVHGLTDKGPRGETVRGKVETEALAAPSLLDYEIASALFGMARGYRGGVPKLEQASLDEALDTYQAMTIRRYEAMTFWPRVRKLSANLSPYDAAYVALAEALQVNFVTSDARIKRAGIARIPVEVI